MFEALARYWSANPQPIHELPIPKSASPSGAPPPLLDVPLPEWGQDAGVDGVLLIPAETLTAGEGELWSRVDWVEAATWYLDGHAERFYERRRGPIHSYSFRLRGWDPRLWDRAWVNRIALFLRAWAARESGVDSAPLLGPLPDAEVVLTHDVDAVRKTVATRIKQSSFHGLNACRLLARGQVGRAGGRVRDMTRFAFAGADYWRFPEVTELEDRFGWRSSFNFYAGRAAAGRSLKLSLMDPSYDPEKPRLRDELRRLAAGGWEIGLHPSFDSWEETSRIEREKDALSAALGRPVTSCRQHWLRFSWEKTWAAQAAAGLRLDTTLGFNDRPGFRNGAALALRPLVDAASGSRADSLVSLPLVLMDAHLYDYEDMTDEARESVMDRWLGEIRNVRGQASLLWHPRVLSPDYGWNYERLLNAVRRHELRVLSPEAGSFS